MPKIRINPISVSGNDGEVVLSNSTTHALGIAAVPYGGYVARLHKDEAVIPAKDNPYRGGNLGGGDTIIIHANVKDYRTLEQIIKDAKEKRQRNRSGGEVYA